MRLLADHVREDAVDADRREPQRSSANTPTTVMLKRCGFTESAMTSRTGCASESGSCGSRRCISARSALMTADGSPSARMTNSRCDRSRQTVASPATARAARRSVRPSRCRARPASRRRRRRRRSSTGCGSPRPPLDLPADRILVGPQPACQHLAEDHDLAAGAAVGVGEETSALQRNAERFEVAARPSTSRQSRGCVGGIGCARRIGGERRGARGFAAGDRCGAPRRSRRESRARHPVPADRTPSPARPSRSARLGQVHRRGDDVLGPEPRI